MDIEQSVDSFWISVDRDNLIESIKLLSSGIGIMTEEQNQIELQIGLDHEEMILCIPGAMSRCKARGEWPGLLSVPFICLYSIMKVPPLINSVMFRFQTGRLKIDRLTMSGIWHYAGMLSSSIALGAHLDSEIQTSQTLYCPHCGKRQGIALIDFALPTKPTKQDWMLYRLEEHREVTHGCKGCGHGWRELV